jgi:hypothetical protein
MVVRNCVGLAAATVHGDGVLRMAKVVQKERAKKIAKRRQQASEMGQERERESITVRTLVEEGAFAAVCGSRGVTIEEAT